jgi:hypothetical protein
MPSSGDLRALAGFVGALAASLEALGAGDSPMVAQAKAAAAAALAGGNPAPTGGQADLFAAPPEASAEPFGTPEQMAAEIRGLRQVAGLAQTMLGHMNPGTSGVAKARLMDLLRRDGPKLEVGAFWSPSLTAHLLDSAKKTEAEWDRMNGGNWK